MDVEPHVSLMEAAAALGLRHGTLLRYLNQGRAPELHAVKVFGRWRVPESAIRALLTPKEAPTHA